MKNLLVIEDDPTIREIVIEEGKELGLLVIPFNPVSVERNDLMNQLSSLCKTNKFDFALLDFELWGGFKGYNFAEILYDNGVKFVAFSSSDINNTMLIRCGAIFSIQKDYNSRGFDQQKLIEGLAKLLK